MMKVDAKDVFSEVDVSHTFLSESHKSTDDTRSAMYRKTAIEPLTSLDDANRAVFELVFERDRLLDQIESLTRRLNAPPF